MSAAGEQLTWYAAVDDVRAGRRCLPVGYRTRPVDHADEAVLAELFLRAYSPYGVHSHEAATREIVVTFAGEYGVLDVEASPVIECRDGVVGSVMTVVEAPWPDTLPVPFVIEVMVDPGHRRRGLAECGLRWAAGCLAERGETRVGLRVMSENLPALGLYRKVGFSGDV